MTPLGFYLHVPFCATRCGYCDFNTYTAEELGGAGDEGVSRAGFAHFMAGEIDLAAHSLGDARRPVDTVFIGGGTPTLLPASDIALLLDRLRNVLGLRPGAEVTIEANPDSVTPDLLGGLRAAGVNRISFGMQSAVPHVLRTLDRTHDPEGVPRAVGWARDAGFESLSLDLIYGTPGESIDDWRTSVEAALACEPDHVSAYALIVESGTALARRVRRGEVPAPDDDDLADKYELTDDLLTAAGLDWYEISNWARSPEDRCRHNVGYWHSDDWWGIGPGAHSHVAGVRWWNHKHPAVYAKAVDAGDPVAEREVLDDATRALEQVMLRVRLAEGIPSALVPAGARDEVPGLVERGLLVEHDGGAVLTLTRRGRLLADGIAATLSG